MVVEGVSFYQKLFALTPISCCYLRTPSSVSPLYKTENASPAMAGEAFSFEELVS